MPKKRPLAPIYAPDEAGKHLSSLLQGETDRGCALVGGAMVDEALGDLLHACVGGSQTAWDELFDGPSKPLSSFSSRIALAGSLGFISAAERKDADDIRWIRNQAAHVIGTHDAPWSFGIDGVKQRASRLEAFPAKGAAARVRFIGSVVMLTAGFQGLAEAVREARSKGGQAEALRVAVENGTIT